MARSSKAPRLPAAERAKKKNRPTQKAGNAPGHRQQVAASTTSSTAKANRDPRIGSRKPIPLVGLSPATVAAVAPLAIDCDEARRQLLALEADERFNALLDRVDEGETLNASEQAEFDAFINRHELLLDAAGDDTGEDE
ncbi:MAG: GTPase-activating protein [Gammaproteobacteria bacterium]|nr:GTPase-activating protein [Gammaproteobacteria bacterium]